DKLDAQIVELRKVPQSADAEDNKLMWLNLLKAKSKEEIDMLAQTGTAEIKMAANAWRDFNADEKNRIIAQNREFADWARNTAMKEAKESGEREKSIKIAIKLLKKGMSFNDIAELVDLSLDDVKAIANN
ncbi:MAG: hypothetical protein LBM93_00850, partial [Oscillospiraceae bacterium]|nr:hypothetical protein [Oscillospiraceae bacterium]